MATARRLALGSALAPLLIALSACGTEAPTPGPLASASPTQSTSPVAKPSPTPTKDKATAPTLPEAATRPTAEGAEAFVNYWWQVADYAQHAGDPAPLEAISARNCAGCAGAIETIRQTAEKNGKLTGGRITTSTSPAMQLMADPLTFMVQFSLRSATGVVQYPSKTITQDSSSNPAYMNAAWRNGRWVGTEVGRA